MADRGPGPWGGALTIVHDTFLQGFNGWYGILGEVRREGSNVEEVARAPDQPAIDSEIVECINLGPDISLAVCA